MSVVRTLRRGAGLAMVACMALAAAADPAVAQLTSATLAGTVRDQTGAVLPGAAVTVADEETNAVRDTLTDGAGTFTIAGLSPGSYSVRAALTGFSTDIRRGVVLTVGQQASVGLTLRIGATTETVEVAGGAAFVDLRSSALSAVVSEHVIEELPLNGRNFISLAMLQPGVSVFLDRPATNNSGGLELHINGAPARSNSYLLDGANVRSFYGVGIMTAAETSLGVETVQEFRVVTNSFSADYGRSMGGVINVVTKSGGNDLRGSGFEFHRNSALDARNFFDPVSGPPPFTRNQYGCSLGGPIVRDRTFFFAGGEWLRDRLSVTQVLNVPSAAARAGALGAISPAIAPYLALYPVANGPDLGGGVARYSYVARQPTDERFLQGRIDHTLLPSGHLFVRYTHDRATRVAPLTFESFTNRSASTVSPLTVEQRQVLSPRLLNTVRFSYSRLLFGNTVPATGIPEHLWLIQPWDAPNGAARDFGNFVVGGLSELGATATNPLILNTQYFTLSNDMTLSRGRHTLRFGVLVEHVRNYVMVSTFVRGNYTFPNLPSLLAGQASLYNTVAPGSELDRSRSNMLYGFYVQDDLTRGRLTLNLGLRYEFFTVPTDADGRDSSLRNILTDTQFTVGPAFENPSRANVGPRLGFAWDLRGDGRTSVRAGTGLYFDTDNTFNSAQIIGVFSPPFASFVALANPTFPATAATASPVSPRLVDYGIGQPRLWAFNASVQHQLGQRLAVMAGYAGSRGYDLVRAVEGNPNLPTTLPDGTAFFPATGLVRRNPAWGPMDFRTSGGRSWYNALQTMAQARVGGGQVQASYTLAKVEDLTQGQLGFDTANSPIFPQDPYRADRGPSDFDIRHTLALSVIWPIPFAAQSKVGRVLLEGWQINGVGNFHSGTPFTPTIVANWSRSGSNRSADRPNVTGCAPDELYLRTVQHYVNPACFALPPAGTFGNAGRNSLRGPWFGTVDLSVTKAIPLGARAARALQFRLEAFNLLNRANFAVPSGQIFAGVSQTEAPLASAGQIRRTVGSARQLQLGVKVTF
jgi:hypothetical protein